MKPLNRALIAGLLLLLAIYSDVANSGFTLSTRHKAKDMMFDGKLEY